MSKKLRLRLKKRQRRKKRERKRRKRKKPSRLFKSKLLLKFLEIKQIIMAKNTVRKSKRILWMRLSTMLNAYPRLNLLTKATLRRISYLEEHLPKPSTSSFTLKNLSQCLDALINFSLLTAVLSLFTTALSKPSSTVFKL